MTAEKRRTKIELHVLGRDEKGVEVIEKHDVEIEIRVDWDAIAKELGRVAFTNAARKSKDGRVTVRVIGSKKLSEKKLEEGSP